MRRLAPLFVLVTSTAALATAAPAHADSKATTQPTTPAALPPATAAERPYVLEDHGPNRLLLATGLATLGFAYGVSAYAALTTERDSEKWLLVPVAGPWLTLIRREDCGDRASARCDVESTFAGLFVASGLLQLAGVVQIAAAFAKRELREVDRPVVPFRAAVLPAAVPGGAALAAQGTF